MPLAPPLPQRAPTAADPFSRPLPSAPRRRPLEKELAALIMEGQIHARIDSQAKVLHARHADARSATFKEVRGAARVVGGTQGRGLSQA
jgi:hypothetical protein